MATLLGQKGSSQNLDSVMEKAQGLCLTCFLEYDGDNDDDPDKDPMTYVVRFRGELAGRFDQPDDAAAFIREEFLE